MGDRASVFIVGADVHLYTHGRGDDLAIFVRDALTLARGKKPSRRGMPWHGSRWDDPEYLARIAFSAMAAETFSPTSGIGISAHGFDCPGKRTIIVDCTRQRVALSRRVGGEAIGATAPVPFARFVTLADSTLRRWHRGPRSRR